jgi:type II secretory pathway pseudopilin PulG
MQPPPSSRSAPRAFTLVEIAVILVIMVLMLMIIVPHFFSEMKLRKARRVKADLITLNSAIEHYALDSGKTGGFQPTYADLRKYLDPGSDIYRRDGKDAFGDAYGPFVVGARPGVPQKTADRVVDVAGPDFWSPFR